MTARSRSSTATSSRTPTANWSRWRATCSSRSSIRKGQERASYRIVYGAKLKVDEGQIVKRGDRLAEWNPNSLPILTEIDGIVRYDDLVSGFSLKEVADEKTGVSNKVVIDLRGMGSKVQDLRPAIAIVDAKGKSAHAAECW